MIEFFKNVRKICGDKLLVCNILYVFNDYLKIVEYVLEVGVNIIVIGVGFFLELFKFVESYLDVVIVLIVLLGRVLKIICKKW